MDRTPGGQCSICNHPKRVEIDKALIDGGSYRDVAGRFGVSRSAVGRHKRNGHIAEKIAKVARKKEIKEAEAIDAVVLAHEVQEVANAGSILAEVSALKTRALAILDNAESEGTREACMALREVRGIVELLAKVRGELKGDGVTVNLIQTPQFVEFKAIIMGVMCDECREKLVRELRSVISEQPSQ
jgi:hypothetical protein